MQNPPEKKKTKKTSQKRRTRRKVHSLVSPGIRASSLRLEGAEAILSPEKFLSFPALKKTRQPKPYRPSLLDLQIRTKRTRIEARLLSKSKSAGVPCPAVFAVGEDYILMEKLEGLTLNKIRKMDGRLLSLAGKYLARLHGARIVHGDYTPANLMWCEKKNGPKKEEAPARLFVIDFGLGSVSHDVEDYAVDVLTMKNALDKGGQKSFLAGYKSIAGEKTLKRMKEVEARARYCIRQGT